MSRPAGTSTLVRMNGERGGSYLIVLIMTALLATTGTAAMMLIDLSQNEVSDTLAKYWQTALLSDLSGALQMKETCNVMLTTDTFSPGTAPGAIVAAQVRWKVDDQPKGRPQRIDVNTTLSDYNMHVRSLRLENIVNVGRLTATRTLYSAALMMDASSPLSRIELKPAKVLDIYLEVEGSAVQACYGLSQSMDLGLNTCTAIGGILKTDASGRPEGCFMRPNLPPTSCPNNKYLQGFDGTGAPGTCVDFK